MKLKNKVIIVTGATSSIGKQLVKDLASNGAILILLGRKRNDLEKEKNELKQLGSDTYIYTADLTNSTELYKVASQIIKFNKSIDAIVNLAGFWHNEKQHFFGIPIEKFPDQVIEITMDLLKGIVLLNKRIISKLNANATIIAVSGSFSQNEKGVLAEYVHKKGIENLIQQLHFDLNERGIRTYAIAPWYVWTKYVQKFWPKIRSECLTVEEVSKKIIEILMERPRNLSGKVIKMKPK